jgi:hypothetical protein
MTAVEFCTLRHALGLSAESCARALADETGCPATRHSQICRPAIDLNHTSFLMFLSPPHPILARFSRPYSRPRRYWVNGILRKTDKISQGKFYCFLTDFLSLNPN